MRPKSHTNADDEHRRALWRAILSLKNEDECRRFFIDLCTPGEIHDLTERWRIARLLDEGQLSYRDIAEVTGASTTTIGRVARFLVQEAHQGYSLIIGRTKKGKPAKAKKKPAKAKKARKKR
ncbi:MAG: helix-turn-helix domain-containing protein [Alphaproteobacteria bacterium]|nr:helix-turn-helix domain-containing protein [Alphaproteobacteria bacterium]